MADLRVTDHAVLRYMQRVQGFDVESVRAHIATICRAPAATGAAIYRAEGVKFVFTRDGAAVTTVAPDNGHPNQTHIDRLGVPR